MGSWLKQVADHDIRQLAGSLGLKAGRSNSFGPCPACGSDRRGGEDPRGPCGFTRDGKGWSCHASGCDGAGDLADLVAHKLFGKRVRDLSQTETQDLRGHCAREGWCDPQAQHGVTDVAAMIRRKPGNTTRLEAGGTIKTTARSAVPTSGGDPSSGPAHFRWRETLPKGAYDALWNDPEAAPVLDYLRTERGFSDDTIRRWGLGAMCIRASGKVVERWLTIPLEDDTGTPVNVRFRRIPGPCLYCSPDGLADGPGCSECKTKDKPEGTGRVPMKPKYRVCAGRPMPLFGAKNLTAKGHPVIITEGELDVIALDEYGWGQNVVSGTTGAGSDWPDPWLDAIEPFGSYLLAFDVDDAGHEGAGKLGDKLGRWRCSRPILPRNDAGTCLADGVSFQEVSDAFDTAEGMQSLQLADPAHFTQDIETLINNPAQLRGLQCSVHTINSAMGGLTPGLWVFTGETGEGKTTLTTWLLWDLLTSAQTPSLLTSFEQRPVGTVQKLLRMELGGDFTKFTVAERAAALQRLSAKGVQLVNKYGDVTDDEIIDAVRYARRRRGCRIAMLDHLDFMARHRRPGESEREAKERIVRTLATIGVEDDIIIILIVHPNNLAKAQQRRVEIGDLKGASAIRQDCHGAIVVEKVAPTNQRPFPAAMLYFDKIRSEFGQMGSKRLLAFDPLSCVFAARWEDTPSGKAGKKVVP